MEWITTFFYFTTLERWLCAASAKLYQHHGADAAMVEYNHRVHRERRGVRSNYSRSRIYGRPVHLHELGQLILTF